MCVLKNFQSVKYGWQKNYILEEVEGIKVASYLDEKLKRQKCSFMYNQEEDDDRKLYSADIKWKNMAV